MTHVSSIAGGATMCLKRLAAAATGSEYTGLWSSNASHQRRMRASLTGSRARPFSTSTVTDVAASAKHGGAVRGDRNADGVGSFVDFPCQHADRPFCIGQRVGMREHLVERVLRLAHDPEGVAVLVVSRRDAGLHPEHL